MKPIDNFFSFEKRKVLLFAIVGLSVLVLVSIVTFLSGLEYRNSSKWKTHSSQVLAVIDSLAISMERAETVQRAFLITHDKIYIPMVDNFEEDVFQEAVELQNLVSDNPSQFQLALELQEISQTRLDLLKVPLEMGKAGKFKEAAKEVQRGYGEAAMRQVRTKLDEIKLAEVNILKERTLVSDQNFERSGALFLTGQILAFFLLLGVTVLLKREVDHRGKIQSQLIQARAKAVEASSLKSQFLANMSHEIRTPLNGIIGMTKVLSETELKAEQRGYLEVVRDSSNALLSLINGILDFSKIESGKLQLEETHFQLRSLIDSTVAILGFAAHKNNVQIKISLADGTPDFYLGDPLRIRQILINLLNNAIKFSCDSEILLHVYKFEEKDSNVRLFFEVIDQGIGIDQETKLKIFKSFSQGDDSTTRKYGGTGLGLAITRQLVEMMDGRVDVDSIPGKGSRFFFDLNLKGSKYSAESYEMSISGGNKISLVGHLLIVEDNQINQKVASAMVRKMGHTFKIASNGFEAIEMLQKENFDLVLMDAQMPLMDGYEATRRIRNGEAGDEKKKIPILAVTANAIKGDLELCLEAGMNDYISKPVSQGDLQMKLEKWLRTGVHAIDSDAIRKLEDLDDNGSQSLVMELIQIFIDTSPEVIESLKKSLHEENFQALNRQAHSFKSTCQNIGAIRMASIAAQLEKAKDQDDLTTLHKLIDALNNEYLVAVQELKRYEAA